MPALHPSPGILALTLLALVLAAPATATTAVHLSDEELVRTSDLIVVGRTAAVTSTWVDGDLVTIASVRVDDALKGDVGNTVDVVLPGGVDTSGPVPVAVTWPGAPSLAQGEEAVLFLNRYGAVSGGFAIAGWSQGKFSVIESAEGSPRVSRDTSAVTLVRGESRVRGEVRNERLDELVGRVQSLLQRGGEQ